MSLSSLCCSGCDQGHAKLREGDGFPVCNIRKVRAHRRLGWLKVIQTTVDSVVARTIRLKAKLRPVAYRPILWSSASVIRGCFESVPAVGLRYFERKPTRELIIAKVAMNTKRAGVLVMHNPAHPSHTFNPYFLVTVIRGRYKYLDPYFGAHSGTSAADDQCSIQRDIARKATLSVVLAVDPVKDHW